MKKLYILATTALLTVLLLNATAQENLIAGGDMEVEDEGYWLISNLANDPSSETNYTFGYIDDSPYEGYNGCLHFIATNTGSNGSHIMFYQEVTLKRGTTYQFDMAIKALQAMSNSWFEVYLGDTEPVDGSDYGTGKIPLGGFKWSGWEAGCVDKDIFDGTLRADGCMPHSQDDIMIEGEGDTTMYIGFKAGIWATAWTVEFVVDNISLIESGTTATPQFTNKEVALFPNPVRNLLEINSTELYSQARIINVVGNEMLKTTAFQNAIDVSSLKPGIYFIELKDSNHRLIVKRFSKL
jgi:hypothetical protein